MQALGAMLDYAVNACNQDLEQFCYRFFCSGVARSLFQFSPKYMGLSGIELAAIVSRRTGDSLPDAPPYIDVGSPEYWAGWALAYFQWQTNLTFKKIDTLIPIEEIFGMYSPYHEMDISHFCEKMAELYNSRKQSTNLKLQRQTAGFSQKELSEISGVPLRTIQQYEQGQKNINSAKAETVLRFAKALECSAEDLMEIN